MEKGTKHGKKQNKDEIFEKYFAMGASRTLANLAKELDIKLSKLYRWSRKDAWVDKIRIREEEVLEKVQEDNLLNAVNLKKYYLKGSDAIIRKFLLRLEGGGMVACDVPEFEKLVKLNLLLLGEDTDHVSQDIKITVTEVVERAKKPEEPANVENVDEELKDLIGGKSD